MGKKHEFVEHVEWEPENGENAFSKMVARDVDVVRIERMHNGIYWVGLYRGADCQHVTLGAAGGVRIFGRTEVD